MVNLIIVGNGKWGQKCATTLSLFDDVKVKIAHRNNWKEIIDDGADGVIICTPPSSHIDIALYALSNNIPTMIEKPLSLSLKEAQQLSNFNIPILVDHIHLFSDAYQNLRQIVSQFKIHEIFSFGFNAGPLRDYSSLWDYGSHDFSMILDLTQKFPQNICVQESKQKNGSLFTVKMDFIDDLTSCSLIGNGGDSPTRQLRVLSGGLEISYDEKNQPSPPLTNALSVFVKAIHGHHDYRLGIDLALKVLRVLEWCDRTLL